jgi:glycosyltransferase involved in cell wall biosynthesis
MVYEISRGLVERGHSVTVVTSDALDWEGRIRADRNPVSVDGIRVFYLRNISNWLAWNHNFSSSPGLVPVLGRQTQDCDIVHMHELRSWENVVGHYFASSRKVPYVISTHGTLLHIVGKRGLKRVYDSLFGYRLLRGAERLITSSKGEADQYPVMLAKAGLRYWDKRRVVVIPHGISARNFREMPPREEFRRQHNIGDDEKVILFLGRLHAVKGLQLLLDAFIGLCADVPALRLILAGPDEGEQHRLRQRSLQAGLGDKVLFPGLLTAREKAAALVSADVFAHPSQSEALPLSVLEACASGLPVVVTRACNIPEVAEYQAGFVIGDSLEELREAIGRALGSPDLRRTLGAHGRRMVAERFTWDRLLEQLEGLYREVIADRRRKGDLCDR